jgi:hypothetical protein
MNKKLNFILFILFFACSENIEPESEILSKDLLIGEVAKLNRFGDLIAAQQANLDNLRALTRDQKDRLIVIQPDLYRDFRSQNFRLAVDEVDKITSYQDWSDYILEFHTTLKSKYLFDDEFFVREVARIMEDHARVASGLERGKSKSFPVPDLYYFGLFLECTLQCQKEAKEKNLDEAGELNYTSGCLRGCQIYDNLARL